MRNTKILLALAVILCLCSACKKDYGTTTITGTAFYSNGKVMPAAFIKITGYGTISSTLTGSDGKYELTFDNELLFAGTRKKYIDVYISLNADKYYYGNPPTACIVINRGITQTYVCDIQSKRDDY